MTFDGDSGAPGQHGDATSPDNPPHRDQIAGDQSPPDPPQIRAERPGTSRLSSQPTRRRAPLIIAGGLAVVIAAVVAGYATYAHGDGPVSTALFGPPRLLTSASATTPPGQPASAQATAESTVAVAASAPGPTAVNVPAYAMNGPNTYSYAAGQSAVFGTAGPVRAYRVAVETGAPVKADDFAAMVDRTLSDPRSWIAGNNVRLQRVPENAQVDFTVYLVTPGTTQKLCLAGGLDIYWHGEPYSSCRVGAKVVINLSRYLKAVPDYGAPLEAYQQYAINHEVGHALGHDHELCPAKGQPAPVMQQQTFSLQGCVANSWPYVDGKRYAGPPGRIVPTD